MKRFLNKLDRKLKIHYFNQVEPAFVGKTYTKCLIISTLLTVIPLLVIRTNILLIISCFTLCIFSSNGLTSFACVREFDKRKTNKVWYKEYKTEVYRYLNIMEFNGEITKPQHDAYRIYEKIEHVELELIYFQQREDYLESLAGKQLTYTLDLVEELDNMPPKARRQRIADIIHEDSARFECCTM